MLKPTITSGPAVEFITRAEAKAHLRVDATDDASNALIDSLIDVVIAHLDGYAGVLGRALINQSWKVLGEQWPTDRIRLPLAPVSAITSVKYYDTSNVQQTLASSNYGLFEDELSPYVGWLIDAVLPSVYSREDATEVIFVTGYGAAAENVPAPIKQAALLLLEHWYENRGPAVVGTIVTQLPLAVQALINPYRRVGM